MTSWRNLLASAVIVCTTGAVLVGCASNKPTPHPSSRPSHSHVPSASPSPSPTSARLTLTVISLPTTYGVPGAPGPYPATVRVLAPPSAAGEIAAYGVGGAVVVGPSGWAGSGQVGADGGVSFTLEPSETSPSSGESLVFQFDGACVGCSWGDASAYYPTVAQALPSAGTGPASTPPPGLRSVSLGSGLLGYSLPAANTTLQVNGVAYTNLPAGTASPVFENLAVTLPTSQHPLATVILNALIANEDRYVCASGSAPATTSLVLTTGGC